LPLPAAGSFDIDKDPTGALKAAFTEQVKNREKRINKMMDDRVILFDVIRGNLSLESRQKVEESSSWGDIKHQRDPLLLLRRIRDTHSAGEHRTTIVSQQLSLIKYYAMRMGSAESITAYLKRFQDQLLSLTALGLDAPPQHQQSVQFILTLDSRWAQFRADLENQLKVIENFKYPDTLLSAFDAASNYQMVVSSSTGVQATAFVTTTTKKKKANKIGINSNSKNSELIAVTTTTKSSGSSDNRTNVVTSSDNGNKNVSSRSFNKPALYNKMCKLCHAPPPTHFIEQCHLWERCSSAAKAAQTNHSVNYIFSRVIVSTNGNIIKENPVEEFPDIPQEDSVMSVLGDGWTSKNIFSNENLFKTIMKNNLIPNGKLAEDDILLDNQATISIFRSAELLKNIRRTSNPITISGINSFNKPIVANHIGYFRDLGWVYYHPEATANILSFAAMVDQGLSPAIKTDDNDEIYFTLSSPSGAVYRFVRKNNLYACSANSISGSPNQCVLTNIVEIIPTQKDIDEAKKIKLFMHNMGYLTPASVCEMINTGGIINNPYTTKQIRDAYKLLGPDLSSVRGRTVKHASTPAVEVVTTRVAQRNQSIHVDIMFISGTAFFISIATPLGLTMSNMLGSKQSARSMASIKTALGKQLAAYHSRGFKIVTLHTDNEGATIALSSYINTLGIVVNPMGPGQHVPLIDRKIR